MKVNLTWQLPLCAGLLLTINACENRNAPNEVVVAEAKLEKITTEAHERPGNDYKFKSADDHYATADTAAAMPGVVENEVMDKPEERTPQQQTPPQTPQQSPGQQPNKPQQPSPEQSPAANPDWDKKIIKHGTLSVEVKDYAKFDALAHNVVKQLGGYVANEEQNESDYKIENSLTVKVPVAMFDEAIQALAPGKEKILVKKITAQDVTGEVVDTKSRLEAKREVRLRYLELLRQAKKMDDILQVQQEINEIQENIEAAAGRVQYLTHAAAYSTIELSYFQVLDPKAVDKETPPGFGEKILIGLTAGLTWIGDLLVLLVTLWPLWAAVAALWWLYRKYRLGKRITAALQPPVRQPIAAASQSAAAANQPPAPAGQDS